MEHTDLPHAEIGAIINCHVYYHQYYTRLLEQLLVVHSRNLSGHRLTLESNTHGMVFLPTFPFFFSFLSPPFFPHFFFLFLYHSSSLLSSNYLFYFPPLPIFWILPFVFFFSFYPLFSTFFFFHSIILIVYSSPFHSFSCLSLFSIFLSYLFFFLSPYHFTILHHQK